MAYVRTKWINGNPYRYIQESYRINGKVKTRHIAYIGTGGIGTTVGGVYEPGTDPTKELTKQDNKKIDQAVQESKKTIAENKQDTENIKKYDEQLKNEGDSQQKHQKNGEYTPTRKKLHDKLLATVDNPEATPKKGRKPQVVFIGGLTASGKTSTVAKTLNRKEGIKNDYEAYPHHVYLNADDFKSLLPEYKGYNANYLHEESSDVFDRGVQQFRKQRKNIIIDATLKNTKSALQKIKKFKDAGYEVKLIGTNIKGESSINRATARFQRSKRYVPPELIAKNAEPTNKSVLRLRHHVDKYKIYDTDIPKGAKPELIESTKSLAQDRKETAETVVTTEKEWRAIGTEKSDLKGYDTKKYKKVIPYHPE